MVVDVPMLFLQVGMKLHLLWILAKRWWGVGWMGTWVEWRCLLCLAFTVFLLVLHDFLLILCIHDNARSIEGARLTSCCMILSKLPEPGVAVGHLHFFTRFDFLHKLHIIWRGFDPVMKVEEHDVERLAGASVSAFDQIHLLDTRHINVVLVLYKTKDGDKDILDVCLVELVIDARNAQRRDLNTSGSHFEQVGGVFFLCRFCKRCWMLVSSKVFSAGGTIMNLTKNLFQFFFNLLKKVRVHKKGVFVCFFIFCCLWVFCFFSVRGSL